METKALKAKRPGFSDDRYNETQYYVENGKTCLQLLTTNIPRVGVSDNCPQKELFHDPRDVI